jgi:methylated-DNA-[protein]-cysteine S-methyltransferase
MTTFSTFDSPVGELLLVGDDDGLRGLYLPDHKRGPSVGPGWKRDDAALAATRAQLAEYFAGERTGFDVPVAPSGTPFQLEVWEQLKRIPYGETRCYGDIAKELGRPGAARAVGAANGRNPISIVVPCHRVVGSTGTLTGYAGGVAAKERLLALERRA